VAEQLKLLDEALHWINLAEIEELSAAGAAASSRTSGAPGQGASIGRYS
jgi:hypothetical protein